MTAGIVCFCGNSVDVVRSVSEATGCEPCAGDPTQTCGARFETSIYTTGRPN